MARWFSIYFPEIKDVYRNSDAVSGLMVIKQAPLPCDIRELGVEGVNKIWRDARLKGAGIKRATNLVTAAEHSFGNTEAPRSARKEIRNLLEDYEGYKKRMDELMEEIEKTLSDKLMEINGIGIKTVSCFIAEVGDIRRFDNPKQVQKFAGYAIVADSSGKHNGESRISHRGRKRLRYALYEAAISVIGKTRSLKRSIVITGQGRKIH